MLKGDNFSNVIKIQNKYMLNLDVYIFYDI